MWQVELIWFVMGAGLIAYVLTGGADLGGGVLDLFATGPRKNAQRQAIERAIAPIWEANHVWLIFVIVLMFTVFPRAFAAISTALHIPIALALLGIVFRGSAFVFRAYGLAPVRTRTRWGRVFAWSSVATPLFLGTTLGALGTGAIDWHDGVVRSGFLAGWTTPFAWLVGLFAITLFSLLASVYLTVETDGELRNDFRRRALGLEVIAGSLAALVFLQSQRDAPQLATNLAESSWTWLLQGATAGAAICTMAALWRGHFTIARLTVAAQVALVVLGFGLAMDHHLILPDLSITNAGARAEVAQPLVIALGVGSLLLGPSLWYLMRIFKGAANRPPEP